jgi:predicted ferric reductase
LFELHLAPRQKGNSLSWVNRFQNQSLRSHLRLRLRGSVVDTRERLVQFVGMTTPGVISYHGSGASRWVKAALWILIYLLLASFPLIVLLAGPIPEGAGFWWDFSMAIGFAGLAIMGLQFVLTARFRRATAPFGIDIIYYFHRWAAVLGLGLILGHYLILRFRHSEVLASINPLVAPWQMTAGRVALLLFLVIIASSLWRKQLGIDYDRWRIWHGILAVAALVLAIAHIAGVGYYTRAPWKQTVWIGYSAFWLLVLGYIRVVKPLRLLRNPYRVSSVRAERGSAWTLTLEPEGHEVLPFKPGQFAWLTLGRSPFRAKEHPFSFSGSAEHRASLQFTIKELGDFTRTIKHVKTGEIAYVDGPHGIFTTDHYPHAPGFVMVAGGVGIAPIMSMLRTLADRHERRPLYLIYGNSSWERVLFREELDALTARLDLKVTHVLHEPPPDWPGPTGYITEALLRAVLPAETQQFVFFMCGPKPMTDSVQRSLRAMGVPLHRMHLELFDMA